MYKSIVRTSLCIGLILGHSLGILFTGPTVRAVASTANILISELQTNGGTGHSSNEFIELYNPSDADVSLGGWLVQYHSASNSDCINGWSTSPKIALVAPAMIKSHGYFLIAATGYLSLADARFSAGLADSAGAIRLERPDLSVANRLAWGTNTPCGDGTPAASPTGGKSLERRPGIDNPIGGNAIDTDSNSSDFVLRTTPEPQDSTSPIEDPGNTVSNSETPTPTVYLPLKITELLIDPVSPATDAHDEFVEIQNPNSEPVNIGGYSLKTPNSQFHLEPQVIAPGGFTLITSASSTISLSNDGGNIQLLDPTASVVDESAPWPKAVPGAAWASFPDGWGWTVTPTPGAANLFTDLPLPASAAPTDLTATAPDSSMTYLPLKINELFIDPVSPASDNNDEFVELYNPNDEPVDSAGYILKSGSNLGNRATIAHHIIDAHSYLALLSSETGLPLSNSGSSVQLFDPACVAISEAISYLASKPGYAWALANDSSWQWTATPTPGQDNIITLPVTVTKATVLGASVKSKAKAAPKVKAVKTKASPKPKTTKTSKTAKTSNVIPAALHQTSGRTLILILLGLTICYVIYEFRYDLRHTYHRLRGHTKSRT